MALLFLAKGRRPVLVAKLKHGPGDDWNHHRSDLANLTSYVEKKWQRDLTWQVIDPAAASVEDLLQAPVLFLNGRQAPQFTAEQKKRLRDYVDRGGFIFAEACCGGTEFENGFRKLMSDVFPEQEYKLRLLPPEHPIWHAEEPVDPQYVRPLWGIDIGCRTSVVFCPDDLSCYWELARPGRQQQLPERVKAEVAAANAIGINVMAYATNRELKYKFEHFATAAAETPARRLRSRQAVRGQAAASRRLQRRARRRWRTCCAWPAKSCKLRVSTEPRELAMTDPKLFHYHLVFMHGRHNFRLTPRGAQAIAHVPGARRHVVCRRDLLEPRIQRGLCARDGRHVSRAEAGAHSAARIRCSRPSSAATICRASSVASRSAPRADGPLRSQVREGEPYLEGLKLGDRYAVIFSPYDISCALENHESLECEGYTRQRRRADRR